MQEKYILVIIINIISVIIIIIIDVIVSTFMQTWLIQKPIQRVQVSLKKKEMQ